MRRSRRLVLVLAWVLGGLPVARPWPGASGASAAPACFLPLEDGRCLPPPTPADSAPPPAADAQTAPASRGPGVLVKRKANVPPGAFRAGLAAAGFPSAEALAVPQLVAGPGVAGGGP
jgi:hypothetical protein